MTAVFDPSLTGILIFGLLAGICPCNSVICLGLIGYLTSGKTTLALPAILRLVTAFCMGTVLTLLPLGLLAGLFGTYILLINSTVAWILGGILMIAMGLQLLHLYKPPIRRIFNRFRLPNAYTLIGAFLLGLSFGAITVGRGAPMLLIVLTYIALYQTPLQGLLTIFIYAVGLSIPLFILSSVGGSLGQKIRKITKLSGNTLDIIIGIGIILIGIYFILTAFL
ncbi:MAG TPA: sulfite exporter TauE/SafE family protein [Methanocorpusculum sp.]|jgi:cytochrome c-type biogenesis protein|uniref:cytochrome c biogenesis CcdA family protein n=1 Tax=Methanocorpusculum sp. GPch4 TaxID=2527877 RepID=UPI001432EC46|nr:cytochrome c biogenesis protein CcdA [Methanocorpusculum sp. GPch4]MDD2802688.1 cytochrome c biogenesis protein CcdA [Methanocorpusculum sp.]MDD4423099.1 cytochrome c biogenesis protein CcdA [Methanocorpusculum parvum]MDD3046557.1 cytochrome c biogenesis protein CcdA [Methanocorpusculum sp.]MDY3201751.1 cytochrome c biogenesis protein CcdA [Methanocorpusculum sp.]NLC91032.1 cytochrome C biogenesis protein CcdA [Methanocorpusculum parvum]